MNVANETGEQLQSETKCITKWLLCKRTSNKNTLSHQQSTHVVWITCGLNMHFTRPCWRDAINHPRKNGGRQCQCHFQIHSTEVSPRRCHFPLARGNCCPMPTLQHVQSPANCAHHRPPHGKNDANLP